MDYYNRVQNKDISFLDKDFKETFDAAFSACRELEHSFNTAITFMTIFGVDDVEIAQVIQQAQQEVHKKHYGDLKDVEEFLDGIRYFKTKEEAEKY